MAGVGVGIVGYGYWGVNLARNVVAARGVELVGIADPRAWRRDRAQEDHPAVPRYESVELLLDQPEVEAVMLATPASTHTALGLQVMAAGRHVLIEKPLALDTSSAAALVDEAESKGLALMVGHTFLYAPAVERLRKMVSGGMLGQLRYADARRHLGQARSDCDVLWDLGAHDVSILLSVLGERPSQVSGRGYSHMSIGRYDTCFAHLLFPSGVDASLNLSWVNPFKVRLLTLVGTTQMAIYDDVPLNQKVTVYGAGLDDAERLVLAEREGEIEDGPFAHLDLRTSAGDLFIPGLSATEPLAREVEDFGRACATGSRPLADGHLGLEVVRVLEAISTSMASDGSPVTLS